MLKDEDLRKKYDMYGEDGLKEDGPSGRGYKSWNFYKHEFGEIPVFLTMLCISEEFSIMIDFASFLIVYVFISLVALFLVSVRHLGSSSLV